MKDIIKQRFLNKSTEELLEIVQTGQPSYTYDAIEVAEEILTDRNIEFTSKIKFQKRGSFENQQRKKIEDAKTETSAGGLIYMILGFTVIGCFLGLFIYQNAGLGTSYVNLKIDNPSEKEISMIFDDGEPIVIPSKEATQVSIPVGKTEFKMGEAKQTLFFKKGLQYLLNPTREEYVMEEAVFQSASTQTFSQLDQSSYYKKIPINVLMVDTFAVMGPYKLTRDILITNWDYDLDTPMPKSMTVNQNVGSVSKIKVYRKGEFIERKKTTQFMEELKNRK